MTAFPSPGQHAPGEFRLAPMVWPGQPVVGHFFQCLHPARMVVQARDERQFTAAGATITTTDSVTNGPQRFYRLVLSP